MSCNNEPLYNSNINVRFADIDRYTETYVSKVSKINNKKTRAIIVVHWVTIRYCGTKILKL